MEYLIIALVAFLTSILTFFSGFGLGTILTPAFLLFFPVDVAIALTGIVHFANNIFKIGLIGRKADKAVLLRFGIPAILTSFLGAWLLLRLTGLPSLFDYDLWGKTFFVTPVKFTIAVLLMIFSLLELLPGVAKIQFSRNKLILGGALSGFFGGLTGMQGAIRSAFLIKSGLSKEVYIATGVVIACLIDFTRLSVYASRFTAANLQENIPLLILAIGAAITGALIGNRLLKKITLKFIQVVVAVLLMLIAIALGAGWI